MAAAPNTDFSQGSVWKNIVRMSIPITLAQLINILYNIVDRMYIGHIPGAGALALTGLGLCLPVISIVMAFARLSGMGGGPLCSIERGRGDLEKAARIQGNAFFLLILSAVLLTAGAKGKRSALPHSRVMIHQPLGGAQGQASDIEITAREILKTKRELYEILSVHSGVPVKKIEKDADRDYWLSAREAKDYGLIDEVLSKRDK